jgi:hypothetical protein
VIELSVAQQKLLKEIREVAGRSGSDAKGSLTLKLTYAGEPNGTMDVRYDITVKGPKKKLGRTVMFLTPGANLTTENPRQLGLGLPVRDVSMPRNYQDVEPDNDVIKDG